jgi:hypothetical protein
MRSDLGKCVTERPRRNSNAASAKATWYGCIREDRGGPDGEDQLDYDGLTRLPASGRQEGYFKKIGSKSFTDVLGPIKGYLRGSVGRPWDDVYSELCRNLGSGPWPVRHVLTAHVDVATDTYRGDDGRIYYHDRWGPTAVGESYASEFYVHPESGRLCYRARKKRWRYHPTPGREATDRVKASGGDDWYVLIDGLWFLGTYRPYWEGATGWPNFVKGRTVWVFRKIKSCSKKELKELRRLQDAAAREAKARRR